MRYIVKYTYGQGSYGDREFEMPDDATPADISRAAVEIAPASALSILGVEKVEVTT